MNYVQCITDKTGQTHTFYTNHLITKILHGILIGILIVILTTCNKTPLAIAKLATFR